MKSLKWPKRGSPCQVCGKPSNRGCHLQCSLELERRRATEPSGILAFTKQQLSNAQHNAVKRRYCTESTLNYFSKLDK